jgi:hypothetical protein
MFNKLQLLQTAQTVGACDLIRACNELSPRTCNSGVRFETHKTTERHHRQQQNEERVILELVGVCVHA